MDHFFDTIIWGPSLEGIKTAVELKQQGQKVLLAGKFGFPGGKTTESLASLFNSEWVCETAFYLHFLNRVNKQRYGVLYQNQQWLLMHPEAIKRACWEILNEQGIELLFHVVPLEVRKDSDLHDLRVFGREGEIGLTAGQLLDFSDDQLISKKKGKEEINDLIINAFFKGSLPFDMPGFNITRRFETAIGTYISSSVKSVAYAELEKTFNRELDRLSKESWKKYNARILMIPVFPEIKPVNINN
jgi:hypothetical protein